MVEATMKGLENASRAYTGPNKSRKEYHVLNVKNGFSEGM